MYPMRPQMPMLPQQAASPAQQFGYPQMPAQMPAQPLPAVMPTYPAAAVPMTQGIAALAPQQMSPMAAQRMPFGQAPVVGMAGGGAVPQMAQRTTGPDGYGLAQIMRTGTPEARMAALQQMRAGQGGMSGKGASRMSPQQQVMARIAGQFGGGR